MANMMSSFRPMHFVALLEYEREWVEFLITTMAYRARASACDAQMMATDTIVMALEVRARMFCNWLAQDAGRGGGHHQLAKNTED
jgi:hypothetical protein